MSDSILTVLKFCLLALLYVFLMRVVWIVARELRGSGVDGGPDARTRRSRRPPLRASDRSAGSGAWSSSTPRPNAGARYPVDGDATIGRGGGCAVALTFDTFVSQVHARAFDRNGTLWVEDAGSTNGTLVNSKRIDRADEAE